MIVGGETGSTGPSIPVPESGEPGLLQARRLVAESESSPCMVYRGPLKFGERKKRNVGSTMLIMIAPYKR